MRILFLLRLLTQNCAMPSSSQAGATYPCGLRRLFNFVQALCRYGRHALSV